MAKIDQMRVDLANARIVVTDLVPLFRRDLGGQLWLVANETLDTFTLQDAQNNVLVEMSRTQFGLLHAYADEWLNP